MVLQPACGHQALLVSRATSANKQYVKLFLWNDAAHGNLYLNDYSYILS